ncbi:hypothetical protein PRIPAC_85617, partial [Pristionchus pacificus]|uniref:Protein kinase domain-containing protein n=1 Tax=Pristionchus pacificus TaxID=54126 RepID=A0A2A6BGQ8_PRIPA
MWLLGTGAHETAFRNIKTIAECLADELINAAKEYPNNYAIKKKDEPERVAQFNRMFSHGYLIWFAVVDVQIDSSKVIVCGKVSDTFTSQMQMKNREEICSHDVLNQELIHFSKEMLDMFTRVHGFVIQLSGTYSFCDLSPNHIPPFRFTMMRAFDLCMHVYRELSRILAHSQLEPYMVASSNLISDWRKFLEESKPHPSKGIPLWAMAALTFIQTVSHPSFTLLLPPNTFNVKDEYRHNSNDANDPEKWRKKEMKGDVVSPRMKKESREEGLKREERMAIVAKNMDQYMDNRIRKIFVLGCEVVKSREEYTINNYIDPYRRAVPFKWRMIEQIGKGSYGVVFKAVREDGNGLLAVKIIKVERELISVLESEVAVMRDLKHMNLVSYYGAEVRGYCSEGTLEDICVEGMDYSPREKVYSFPIGSSFIVHRDIKPANIFLSRLSIVKLGDFGCARRLRGTDTAVGELKHTAGTLNYMAPEAVCDRVGQCLAQLKNLNSLKQRDLGFSRVMMTMGILIFRIEPSLAPDDVTSKS